MDFFSEWLIRCAFIGWATDIISSVGVWNYQLSTLNQNILVTFDFFFNFERLGMIELLSVYNFQLFFLILAI